jgi:hypothetical protein
MEFNETSYDDKAQWEEVQCRGTITLLGLITELLPFVIFVSNSLSGVKHENYWMEFHETSYNDKAQWEEVQCKETTTLFWQITELLPFVTFSCLEHYMKTTESNIMKLHIICLLEYRERSPLNLGLAQFFFWRYATLWTWIRLLKYCQLDDFFSSAWRKPTKLHS